MPLRTGAHAPEEIMDSLPAAALGHFVMKVANLDVSYQFYVDLGLRQIWIFPDVAIIELRGGTHILLFPENDEAPFPLTSSRLGQRAGSFNEHLDLIINGKTRGELEACREILLNKGIAAGEIAQQRFFGHDYFVLTDPDGHGITVYTSHVGESPV
jgi:catechol 2,3-dioxygenase-like lactoylglutathione lyase family enzyme